MALYLCLKSDGTSPVTNDNPISTKHTNAGDAKTVAVYIANDGMRKGVPNDANPPALIYTNIQIRVEGVAYKLDKALAPSTSDTNLVFDSVEGWNIGTIIQAGTERMRIEEVLTKTSVRVQRNYNADGKNSIISGHVIGTSFVAESTSVSLALPDPANSNNPGPFLNGGESITAGIDPSTLVTALTALETATTVRSNNAALYSKGALIKIDNEIMKITAIDGNDITVIRGYENTIRASHDTNSTIYCVGIVDIGKAHKFYIKNAPPAGLPTQKKSDIKITLMSDEEPQ